MPDEEVRHFKKSLITRTLVERIWFVLVRKLHRTRLAPPQRKPISEFSRIIALFPLLAQKKLFLTLHEDRPLSFSETLQITDRLVHYAARNILLLSGLYNQHVARGWESKSVEEQQAEAAERKSTPKPRLTPAQASELRKLEGLRLSRQRVVQELANSHDPRHRQILEHALTDLDKQIEETIRGKN
jgi:hypothetical protein